MQDLIFAKFRLDFAKIESNLPKSNYFYPLKISLGDAAAMLHPHVLRPCTNIRLENALSTVRGCRRCNLCNVFFRAD